MGEDVKRKVALSLLGKGLLSRGQVSESTWWSNPGRGVGMRLCIF